jgi:hypothetical protein
MFGKAPEAALIIVMKWLLENKAGLDDIEGLRAFAASVLPGAHAS